MQIAFLGLGRMGTRMAGHLLGQHDLVVWNRTEGKAGDLSARGAREVRSVREAVRGADAVVLMLFGPDSVQEVLEDVLTAPQGALVVNATTVGPDDARRYGQRVTDAGLRYVDAPVLGTTGPAEQGTLGVLVGAADQDAKAAAPLLQAWGDPDRIRHVGPVGAGSATKLIVNQGIGVLAAGLGEALALASQLGLERGPALDALAAGPYGWMIGQKRANLDSGDYTGTQFSLELLSKDVDLAVRAAGDAELAVCRAVQQDLRAALDAGHGGQDYSAVIGHLADEGRADSC